MKVAIIFENKGPMAVTDAHVAQVRAALPDAEIRLAASGRALIDEGFDADVLICWTTGGHFIAEEYCRYAGGLKWIHGLSSGVEGLLDSAAAGLPGVRVTSSKGIHGIPMSNHVMGFILSFLRRFPEFRRSQDQKAWNRLMPDEAAGKTLTIIGMGSIGRAVARAAKAFDMTVYGIKRRAQPLEYVDAVYSEDELPGVLGRSDFVTMLLPANEATRHFMNAERFGQMKPGSYFINVGRGQTVDEQALIAALQSGHLAGAALDVADPEPIGADSPLWAMDNVLITPHVAADTPRYMERAFGVFQKNAPLFLAGRPMASEIDLDAKY